MTGRSATRRPAGQERGAAAWRVVGGVLAALVGVLVLLYGVAYAMADGRLPRGTTVRGIPVGGLNVAAAEQRLRELLPPLLDDPITVTLAGERENARVHPERAGLGVDIEQTVAVAGTTRSGPLQLVRGLLSNQTVEPVLAVDEAALGAAVERLADRFERAPRDGEVSFDGAEVVTEPPVTGHTIDQEQAADALAASWAEAGEAREVVLTPREVQPQITQDAVDAAVAQLATPAVSAPVRVLAGGESTELSPALLGRALSMVPVEDKLELRLDSKRLDAVVDSRLAELSRPARDATVRIRGDRPVLVPGRDGRAVPEVALAERLLRVLTERGRERSLTVRLEPVAPERTRADVRKLGIKRVVGEFTTYFPYAEYRNVNIGRAAELIDNTLLEPGDEFSLNGIVGERTVANGFTRGTIISNGQFAEALGGGVSQVATTTFNAMYFAGLRDVEHVPHSFYIDRYPMGREATLAWPVIDLAFANNTPHGVVVDTVFSPSVAPDGYGSLSVRMWSTPYWEVRSRTSAPYNTVDYETVVDRREGCIEQPGVPGFSVDVTRTVLRNDARVRRETFHTDYDPAAEVICAAPLPDPDKRDKRDKRKSTDKRDR